MPAERAAAIARQLVDEGLAACVNLLPNVQSVYRWKGQIESSVEVLVVCKTSASAALALQQRLVELHPYEVPESVIVEVAAGHQPYLDWVIAMTARH